MWRIPIQILVVQEDNLHVASVILFLSFVFLVLAGATIYVPRRFAKLFGLKSRTPLLILFAIGTVSIPISMVLHRTVPGSITDTYYVFTAAWMGLFFYVTLLLLCHHLLGLFLKLPRKASGIAVIALAVLISAYAMWNGYSIEVIRVDIPLEGLRNDVRIALITDVHLGAHRREGYLGRVVATTNELKPDLVLIAGDIADSKGALDEAVFAPLKKLQAPAYFTTGNHETYVGQAKLLEIIEKSNVTVLHNQVVATHGIQLIGLEYMRADKQGRRLHRPKDSQTIKDVMPTLKISDKLPAVLMHHSPVGIRYMNERGVDVVLSGHTHSGGQIFPITLVTRLLAPRRKWAGLFDDGGTAVYVSQGVGTFGPPMRLGSANEITLIRLTKK